jgi:hypothetical protein
MATVMSMLWPGMSLENYDDAAEMVNLAEKPPPGLLFHVAGATAEGLRIIDIWESQEDFERFRDATLAPMAQEFQLSGGPNVVFCEVHNLWAPGIEAVAGMSSPGRPS